MLEFFYYTYTYNRHFWHKNNRIDKKKNKFLCILNSLIRKIIVDNYYSPRKSKMAALKEKCIVTVSQDQNLKFSLNRRAWLEGQKKF